MDQSLWLFRVTQLTITCGLQTREDREYHGDRDRDSFLYGCICILKKERFEMANINAKSRKNKSMKIKPEIKEGVWGRKDLLPHTARF